MEDIVTALAIFVGMPWAIFSGIAKVRAAKLVGQAESLRKSELDAMIQDAVADAVAPFRRRVETLEAIATDADEPQRRLDAAVLADALDPVGDAVEPAAVRRRTRD